MLYPIDSKIPPNCEKRTVNAVKPVSKLANTRLCPYLGNGTSDQRKNTSKLIKKTTNAVKPVLNLTSTRFHPYLGNSTFDRPKIFTKELKIKRRMLYKRFQSQRTHVYARIFATVTSIDAKNPSNLKKKNDECR